MMLVIVLLGFQAIIINGNPYWKFIEDVQAVRAFTAEMNDPAPASAQGSSLECEFVSNSDGTGGSEENIGSFSTIKACIATCKEKGGNGVSIAQSSVTTVSECYCETGQTSTKYSSGFKNCQLKLKGPLWYVGDGTGGDEERVGTDVASKDSCVQMCVDLKKTDASVNGATYGVKGTTKQGDCWCKKGMTSLNADKKFMSRFIGVSVEVTCECRGGDSRGHYCAKWDSDGRWCYVKNPSNCPDKKSSRVDGRFWSNSVCKASSETAYVVNNNDCWSLCGKRGGQCIICGQDYEGYCCSKDERKCPGDMRAAAPKFHTCVRYAKYSEIEKQRQGQDQAYGREITTEWCNSKQERRNICDGTKADCFAKGKHICDQEPTCFGLVWGDSWSVRKHGVITCTTTDLVKTTENGWVTIMKGTQIGRLR